LLVAHIPPVCSLLAPCERGASTQEGDQFISRRTLSLLPSTIEAVAHNALRPFSYLLFCTSLA